MSDLRLKAIALLVEVINETVQEVEGPIPESSVYLAFQAQGISHSVYQLALDTALEMGKIKRGPVAHTLVKA
jgi:hypothetical protein